MKTPKCPSCGAEDMTLEGAVGVTEDGETIIEWECPACEQTTTTLEDGD